MQKHERMNSVREFYPQNVAHNLADKMYTHTQLISLHVAYKWHL